MGTVDPDDDGIRRWVVMHYRYDPARRERRHVVVAAYDDPQDYHADIEDRAARLRASKERGDDVDPTEHISGREYGPGYRHRQQNAHLLRRAVEHGVVPPDIEDVELPSSVSSTRAVRRESPPD